MARYDTPIFSPSDPLVCRTITLRPQLWAVVFNELQRLGEKWLWQQVDITHATVAEVTAEVINATDKAVFAGCLMIGEVKYIATDIPAWCLLCDGAIYDKADYPDLAAVIDSAYEVNPLQFRVPDLLFKFARGAVIPGTEGGQDTVTLTIAEMPSHGHGMHSHSEQDPGLIAVTSTPPEGFALADPGLPSQTGSSAVDNTGGGGSFSVLNPYHDLVPVIVAALPTVG